MEKEPDTPTNMTPTITLKIKRNEDRDKPALRQSEETYYLPRRERATLLQGLIYVYENLEPALAFSYNCRYEKCGLCAVMVNGRPSLSCVTPLQDEQVVAPLSNLPVLKDLLIDRSPLEKLLRKERVFLQTSPAEKKEENEQNRSLDFPVLQVHPQLEKLLGCLECLCCHAGCPKLKGKELEEFAGPYVFLKLAQLHLDERDTVNRQEQARRMGIELCRDCRQCRCPQGIGIYQQAIIPLLQK